MSPSGSSLAADIFAYHQAVVIRVTDESVIKHTVKEIVAAHLLLILVTITLSPRFLYCSVTVEYVRGVPDLSGSDVEMVLGVHTRTREVESVLFSSSGKNMLVAPVYLGQILVKVLDVVVLAADENRSVRSHDWFKWSVTRKHEVVHDDFFL